MNRLVRYFSINGWAFWLGYSLAQFCKVGLGDWQFWAVVAPTVALVIIAKHTKETPNEKA